MNEVIIKNKKLSDMLITCHFSLADRYHSKALILDLIICALSLILISVTFSIEFVESLFSLSKQSQDFIIASCSAFVFFLSILHFIFDWKSLAARHKKSGELFFDMKKKFESALLKDQISESECRQLLLEYSNIANMAEKIADKDFISLKKHHYSKVSLSQMIDQYPHCPLFILKVISIIRDSRTAIKNRGRDD